ncbi:MAG TPA: hypothetical protein VGR35_09445 [Tepidisphaeraceae bacterium]|nr:hypothetical protein [Tepidisphaeraceae bacterium]
MGTKAKAVKPADRLPQKIIPNAYYVNISSPPRNPADAPKDSTVIICYDGGNDSEIAELTGACEGVDYQVLILSLPNLDHIAGVQNAMFGLSLRDAYRWNGRSYDPRPALVASVAQLVADDPRSMVAIEQG